MSTKRRYPCPEGLCEKTFAESGPAKRHHRSIHLQIKSFVCQECSTAHQSKQNLERHQLTHRPKEDRPYACDQCDLTCTTEQNLTIHKNGVHLNLREYTCQFDECGNTYKQAAHLTQHIRKHLDLKPFVCSVCGYAARQTAHLAIHMLRHTGELPHICDKCPEHVERKAFTTPQQLVIHDRQYHTGERPFACPVPGCQHPPYASSGALAQHVQSHTPVFKYVCPEPLCDNLAYRHAQSLAFHMQSHHTEEGQQRKKKKETIIFDLLKHHDISFNGQHTVDFRCVGGPRETVRGFIDFMVEVRDADGKLTGIIFLEVDEDQHKSYAINCDTRRMADVYESLIVEGNSFPILFIRYNPDVFKVNSEKTKVLSKDRQARLINLLKNWDFTQPFAILYMYYDTNEDGCPKIFDDAAYNEAFKEAFIGCIID